ncbi:MAG TPA: hypothetical protein VN892_03885 [Solirubrobacteraceae bacterium]|nr:hypothetical protein [Solirubrobacteraceae bacterium]
MSVREQVQTPTRPAPLPGPRRTPRPRTLTGGGTMGNELLTAATGAVLLVGLAVIGVTILRVRQLLWIHLFVGMLLIGPVTLKLASTGYRFIGYYTANPRYRLKGPPLAPLRMIAPIVVISTLVVFGTGVALLFAGPSSHQTLLPIHKDSFFVWVAFMALHLLGHVTDLPRALRTDYGRTRQLSGDVTGRAGRMLALAGALVAGAVLAILVIPEFGPWLDSSGLSHHH